MDAIPKNWYLELEMHRDIVEWEYITQWFQVTFTFQSESAPISTTLQEIKWEIFIEEEAMKVISICSAQDASMMVHKLLECYNVTQIDQDNDDPRYI